MKWRPKNWNKIIESIEPEHCAKGEHVYSYYLDGIEDGANAIIDALMNNDDVLPFSGWETNKAGDWIFGTRVFIPDEYDEKHGEVKE